MAASLLRQLPKVLLGVTSVALAAYVAWRNRPLPMYSRQLPLEDLEQSLANWLPKLAYVSFIRIEAPGSGRVLWLAGHDTRVQVSAPAIGGSTDQEDVFRAVCQRLGLQSMREEEDGEPRLTCRVDAGPAAVHALLEALLRELYGARSGTMLTATVPLAG